MKIFMPNFYKGNDRKHVPQEDFIEYYKKYFNQDINKIHKFLLALAYNGITNFEIDFDSNNKLKSFTLYLMDNNGEIEFLFEFHKNENENIKTQSTLNVQIDMQKCLKVIKTINEVSKFL